MQYLEDQSEFMDLDDNGDEDTYTATCHECGDQFTLHGDEDPKSCPNCDIDFIQGQET